MGVIFPNYDPTNRKRFKSFATLATPEDNSAKVGADVSSILRGFNRIYQEYAGNYPTYGQDDPEHNFFIDGSPLEFVQVAPVTSVGPIGVVNPGQQVADSSALSPLASVAVGPETQATQPEDSPIFTSTVNTQYGATDSPLSQFA